MSDKSNLSVYARSFYWAGFFLPKETYKKCSALYDFCRIADNIADDDEKIESKEKKFDQFENDFNQKNFENPIIKNMWDLIEEFNISLRVVQDLLVPLDNMCHFIEEIKSITSIYPIWLCPIKTYNEGDTIFSLPNDGKIYVDVGVYGGWKKTEHDFVKKNQCI